MQPQKMKLSIIVPVYNAEKWLRRCVVSLLNQDIDKSEYEILLIDDGSKDGSLAIAHQLATEASNIRVFTQPNAGPGAARNRGIDNANGDYLMFVDADDYLKPNSLAPILDIAISNSLDLCRYHLSMVKANGTIQQFGSELTTPFILTEQDLTHYPLGTACNCLFLKRMIYKYNIRFASMTYDEDTLFMTHIIAFSEKVIDTGQYIYLYDFSMKPTNKSYIIKKEKGRLMDNINLALKTKELTQSDQIRPQFKRFLSKRVNSIIVSQAIMVLHKKNRYGCDFTKEYFQALKQSPLFPIKGRTLSWKTTIAIPLINLMIYALPIFMPRTTNKRIN